MTERLTLYGRRDCPLCDEMGAGLGLLGVGFDFVDIDADPGLKARYDWDVPVLVGVGGEVCWHFGSGRRFAA